MAILSPRATPRKAEPGTARRAFARFDGPIEAAGRDERIPAQPWAEEGDAARPGWSRPFSF